MTYTAHVKIMPLKDLLDPQGKAVMGGLKNLGINAIEDVRVGKHIVISVNAESSEDARRLATEATEKLLANPVMETFEIDIQ